MQRALMLSIVAGLALAGAGGLMAQSRTVSTADMPKPGVSYIQGPTPVRRETVRTGYLPVPPHLYVGGASRDRRYDDRQNDAYPGNDPYPASDDGYSDGGYTSDGYYGGNYDLGYPGGHRNGHGGHGYGGNDHGGNGHGNGNDHGDHGNGNGYPNNSLTLIPGPAPTLPPLQRPGSASNRGTNPGNGIGNNPTTDRPPPSRPTISAPPARPSQSLPSAPTRPPSGRVN